MTHLTPSKSARSAKMLSILNDLVAGLPTADEKKRASESLTILIEFLNEIKDHLKLVPTLEDMRSMTAALAHLDSFLARAESDPVLARAIGIEKPKTRPAHSLREPLDPTRVQGIVNDLSSLTIDQVRERLGEEDAYSLADLRALARQLGSTFQQRTSRQALVGQIVTKLGNTRGYQALSRTTDPNEVR